MGNKSPSARGYHSAMLTQRVFDQLTTYKDQHSLSSITSAVQKLFDDQRPGMSADEVDKLIAFAAITGKSAQKVRDWFGV